MPRFDAFAFYTDTPISHRMATSKSVQETMKRYDTKAVALTSGIAADCDFVAGNQQLRDIVSLSAGIYGYVTLNLAYSEESQEQQRQYLFKREFLASVVFGREGHPVTLEDASDVVNAQRRYTKPMVIHTPDAESVHEAAKIAVEFPSIKFIFLTMGGDDWHIAVNTAKRHLNIYLETSGSMDSDKITHASTVITPRKLLYGSALPYSDPELTAGLIDESPTLTAADRTRIYYQNAAMLFGLESDLGATAGSATE